MSITPEEKARLMKDTQKGQPRPSRLVGNGGHAPQTS